MCVRVYLFIRWSSSSSQQLKEPSYKNNSVLPPILKKGTKNLPLKFQTNLCIWKLRLEMYRPLISFLFSTIPSQQCCLYLPSQKQANLAPAPKEGKQTNKKKKGSNSTRLKTTNYNPYFKYILLKFKKKLENDRVHSLLFSNSSEMLYWEFSTVQVHKQYFYAHQNKACIALG